MPVTWSARYAPSATRRRSVGHRWRAGARIGRPHCVKRTRCSESWRRCMESKTLYCMECVEGRPVALGLCADCLAGEPLEEVIRQIARLSRELETAKRLIGELVDDEDAGVDWTGTRVVCAYCSAADRYGDTRVLVVDQLTDQFLCLLQFAGEA